MINIRVLLLISIIITISACSKESLKRAGYETLQNIQQLECQKNLALECSERESFDTYQRKIEENEDI